MDAVRLGIEQLGVTQQRTDFSAAAARISKESSFGRQLSDSSARSLQMDSVVAARTSQKSSVGRRVSNASSRSLYVEANLSRMSDRSVAWYANFVLVSCTFAGARGITNTALEYTPVVLTKRVDHIGKGMLFTSITVMSIVSSSSVRMIGAKNGFLLCSLSCAAFFACFIACTFVGNGPDSDEENPLQWLQWPLFLLGGFLIGMGASHGFTAVGPYLDRTAAILVEEGDWPSKEVATTKLAGMYGFSILLFNALVLVIISGLQAMRVPMLTVLVTFGSIVLMTAFVVTMARDPPVHDKELDEDAKPKLFLEEVSKAFTLWGDPKLWLLCFLNVNTGVCDAFKVSNFNLRAKHEIGEYAIGVLTLLQYFSGMLLVKIYEPLAQRVSKGLVLLLGSIGYLLMPLLYWYSDASKEGWCMAIYFLLAGNGMAVYESVNRAIFTDFFPGEQTEMAFANIVMQNSLASAACFFLGSGDGRIIDEISGSVIVVLSLATYPCYILANRLRDREVQQNIPDGLRSGEPESAA